MKAILLAPLPPPSGGIASWAKRMKEISLKNNWQVIVVDEKVIGGRTVFGKSVKKNIFVEIVRCLKIWKNLWLELNDREVKIVHSNIPAGFTGMLREIICCIITKVRGRKFIIHYRCTVPNMVKSKKSIIIFKILNNISNAIITLNTQSKMFAENNSKSPVYLIPNFVSASEVASYQMKNNNKEKIRVLYVGGVIREKGCLDLIEVAKRVNDVDFRFVGSIGIDINDINIPKNIKFCGEISREDVQLELRNADIFAFPSFFYGEGFSNALAEAMASGLPCVAYDWAANMDMIENKGGFIIKVHDIKEFSESIKKLRDSEEIRMQMGNWNIQKIRNEYSQKKITDKYIDLYEKII